MPAVTPAVEAERISVSYGPLVALAPSDLTVPAGSVTALIGPNGSGKTTLLSVVAGLQEPDAGSVLVLGQPPAEARSRTAYVLQTSKVNESLPVTVREVVTMARYAARGSFRWLTDDDRRKVRTAMERLAVDDLAGRHLVELSGGQRQRVFVAQGLAQDRDLLLLDEPLTGLDLVSARAIESVIAEERAAGRTVVYSTHDLANAATADHAVLLASRVVAAGPPASVLTSEHLAEAYGARLLELAPLFMDDAAHRPVPGRHVHARSVFPKTSGGGD